MAYASLLGVIGCFGSTFADAGMRLNAVSGYDRVESTRSKQGVKVGPSARRLKMVLILE